MLRKFCQSPNKSPHRKYLAEHMLRVIQAPIRVSPWSLALLLNLLRLFWDEKNEWQKKYHGCWSPCRRTHSSCLICSAVLAQKRIIKKNLLRLDTVEERSDVWVKKVKSSVNVSDCGVLARRETDKYWRCDVSLLQQQEWPGTTSAWQLNNVLYAQELLITHTHTAWADCSQR